MNPPSVLYPCDPYDEHGVDITLIQKMLALSPLERLRQMERAARDTRLLNEYGRRHREAVARRDRESAS